MAWSPARTTSRRAPSNRACSASRSTTASDRRTTMADLSLPYPYLLFLGDTTEPGYAKTAFGLRDWAPERCIGEFSVPGATVTTGLPFLSPAQAHAAGARAMVIGVANAGGFIPPTWLDALIEAMQAGLDLIGGMHARLRDFPVL